MREIKSDHLRWIIRDLVVDARCAYRDGLPDYTDQCREKIARFFKNRRDISYDHWGMPKDA